MKEKHIIVPRSARFYTSGDITPDIDEIWFVLHGYGQLAKYFIKHFKGIVTPQRLIVAPEALSRFYLDDDHQRVGATWMTREDRNVEMEDYIKYLDILYSYIQKKITTPFKLVVLGFSQGTSTAMRWITRGKPSPELVILWAGEIPSEIDLTQLQPLFQKRPLQLVLGKKDEFIPTSRLTREEKRLQDSGISYQIHFFDGGHRIDPPLLKKLSTLLSELK
ncbi:MAG: phospholipase [Calditrichaeota bacterium]|nr:MAG: phospholipase [Calditrichota bacterium]